MTHFLDLKISNAGIKSEALENLTKEKFYISQQLHTSYIDLDEITYVERRMLLKFITEQLEAKRKAYDQAKMNAKGNYN